MSDPIIILKAKRKINYQIMNDMRNVFLHQMKEGLMVVPDDFEVTVVNPEQLDCEISEVDE